MRLTKGAGLLLLVACMNFSACSNKSGSPALPVAANRNGVSLAAMSGPNVLSLTVNGALCASGSYNNKPCVSITLCSPTTGACQTLSDILLDTGSYGLRVFKSLLTVPLTPLMSGGNQLTECANFGDGSSEWGPVESASLVLAGEPAVNVPIQVIDSTYANSSTYCGNSDTGPAMAGFNGILGLGLLAHDCGPDCVTTASNHTYFACDGTSCSGAAVSLANQVQNPVALLPKDNNGVVVELPAVAPGGDGSADGYVIFGIGTETNNHPATVNTLPADPTTAEITTQFEGNSMSAILDTGSNAIYFAETTIPNCGTYQGQDLVSWYCPSGGGLSFSATNTGYQGLPATLVPFSIGNMISLVTGGGSVFADLGGVYGNSLFDWGLPFYFGKNVYHGIEGKSSSLGTGPYWAY